MHNATIFRANVFLKFFLLGIMLVASDTALFSNHKIDYIGYIPFVACWFLTFNVLTYKISIFKDGIEFKAPLWPFVNDFVHWKDIRSVKRATFFLKQVEYYSAKKNKLIERQITGMSLKLEKAILEKIQREI